MSPMGSQKVNNNFKNHFETILLLAIMIAASIVSFAVSSDDAAVKQKTVTLMVAGETRIVNTVKPTVQQLLWQEFISLSSLDRCSPGLQTPLADGMTVTVDRVRCETVTERVSVTSETVVRYIAVLASTESKVLEQGKDGVHEEIVKTWYLNGIQTSVERTKGKVITASKPTIIIKGTADNRGLTIKKTITVTATAYEPGPTSCGKWANGYTATGLKAGRGVIAVDPKVIPLGTRVYVEGYGYAVAADTGGAIKGNKIDVCMDTVAECRSWGRKTVKLHVFG